MKGVYVQGQLKLDTERSSFSAHDRSISNREKTPVTDSQHSTDAEKTPTAEALREVLDGPIDMKLRLIQHQAKMAAFRPRRSLRRKASTPLFSS